MVCGKTCEKLYEDVSSGINVMIKSLRLNHFLTEGSDFIGGFGKRNSNVSKWEWFYIQHIIQSVTTNKSKNLKLISKGVHPNTFIQFVIGFEIILSNLLSSKWSLKWWTLHSQALDSIKKATAQKAAPKKKDKEKDKAGSKDKEKDKAGSTISDDDAKRLEKEVSCIHSPRWTRTLNHLFNLILLHSCQIDDLTKKFIKAAEDMCKAKEKEIKAGWINAGLLTC